jgi:hypothetical protein
MSASGRRYLDDLDRLGIPVAAGFSTHPHWDHLLWHPRFGDVPRYATTAARAASEARERGRKMAAEGASGIPLELLGLVTPLRPVIDRHQASGPRRRPNDLDHAPAPVRNTGQQTSVLCLAASSVSAELTR